MNCGGIINKISEPLSRHLETVIGRKVKLKEFPDTLFIETQNT